MDETFTIPFVVFKEPEGKWYIASCPVLDVVTQGATPEEAVQNIRDAVALYLEDEHTEKPSPESLASFRSGFLSVTVKGGAHSPTRPLAKA